MSLAGSRNGADSLLVHDLPLWWLALLRVVSIFCSRSVLMFLNCDDVCSLEYARLCRKVLNLFVGSNNILVVAAATPAAAAKAFVRNIIMIKALVEG